jgi:predicted RNA-binding Zn-ribbon protein involved in translation (DUF1610 family)
MKIYCTRCNELIADIKLPFVIHCGNVMNTKTKECREDSREFRGKFELKCEKCGNVNNVTI